MQYAILIYGDQKQLDSMTVEEKNQDFGQWMQYTKDLGAAGVMRGGEALQPTGTATTVRVRNGKTRNTLAQSAQVALALRTLCSLSTAEIAAVVELNAAVALAMAGGPNALALATNAAERAYLMRRLGAG